MKDMKTLLIYVRNYCILLIIFLKKSYDRKNKNIFLEYVYFRTILIINAILMNTKFKICLHVSLCTAIT